MVFGSVSENPLSPYSLDYRLYLKKERDYHSYQWMLLLLPFFVFCFLILLEKEKEETSTTKNY